MASRVSRGGIRLLLITGGILVALTGVEAVLWISGYPLGMYPVGLFQHDDRIGYHRLTPGFSGRVQTGETLYRITVNSGGMRGKELQPREAVGWRILGLGDSFTFGIGVEDDQTYPAQLETLFHHANPAEGGVVEVLNAGVPGYGTVHELRYLEHLGLQSEPDLVLLGFYAANDLSDNRDPDAVQTVQGVLVPAGRVKFVDLKIWLRKSFRTYGVVANALKRQEKLQGMLAPLGLVRAADPGSGVGYPGTVYYLKDGPAEIPKLWEGTQRLLVTMHEQLRARQIPLVVISIPDRVSVYDTWLARAAREAGVPMSALDGTKPDRELAEFCRREAIPFVDLIPALRAAAATNPSLYFYYDGHWTETAHHVAALRIFQFLQAHPELRRSHRRRVTTQDHGRRGA